jgi:hypothetical protein
MIIYSQNVSLTFDENGTAWIGHLCKDVTNLSYHRFLMLIGLGNKLHLYIRQASDFQTQCH